MEAPLLGAARTWITDKWQHLSKFTGLDLWRISLPPLWSWKGIVVRLMRIIHLVVRGFREDEIRLHASSLTYNALIALVPLLAISLSLLKGLGYDTSLQNYLQELTQEMPTQIQDISTQLLSAVDNANFAQIGGIGGLLLLWVVIQMLSRIERSFNTIWGIHRSRSWLRNSVNYISIVVVVPILLISAITLTAQFKWGGDLIERLGLVRLIPFVSVWLAFSFCMAPCPIPGFVPWLLWALVLWVPCCGICGFASTSRSSLV